jgi:excisionase family DNA binding protein
MSAPGWLSIDEAARGLGVERHCLYDAVNRGEIPHRRVGRRVLVDRSWVESDVSHNGQPALDPEDFAERLARAVLAELGQAFTEAAERATAPGETGTVLDPDACENIGGRRELPADSAGGALERLQAEDEVSP